MLVGSAMWHGDFLFLLQNLVLKDFRVRYRNMSLGVFWSLLNPLLMMGVLTFVWTKIVPISADLSSCLHLGIQILLLLLMVLGFGLGINIHWLWLPLVWALEIVFVCGLALLTSAINVFIRDVRYVVESTLLVMFWLVPIFYGFENIPQRFAFVYELNPVAALIFALRSILLHATQPHSSTLLKLTVVSFAVFAIGWVVFRKLKDSFYEHI